MSLRKNERGKVLISLPSDLYNHGIYQAPVPQSPITAFKLDAAGFEETENWAKKICKKQCRDISMRVFTFVQRVRHTCQPASRESTSRAARERTDSVCINQEMFAYEAPPENEFFTYLGIVATDQSKYVP